MLIEPRLTSALLVLMAFLGGCAATPGASPASDAEAKRFESAPGAAFIYLYRPGAPGGRGPSTLWVDGRLVGATLPTSYFRIAVRPGRNRITASGGDAGRLEIDTRADGVYFVEMQVFGESESEASTLFRGVTPEVGKAAIQRCCTLLETWRPGQRRMPW
jgi:hypothetical protein